MRDKKGVIGGLRIVQVVMIIFLAVVVIAVALFLTLSNLRDVAEGLDTETTTIVNITTIAAINDLGSYASGTQTLRGCALTITGVINQTDRVFINSANYTVTGCLIQYLAAGQATRFNNTLWNITGSYTYPDTDTEAIYGNVSEGVTDFFGNTTTIFSILFVVVIIMAIAIIIVVVSRFGGRGAIGSEAGGSRSPSTVMGI